jgi:predicted RNA-binding protein with PUA-like domain
VVREAYLDPTDADGKFVAVTVRSVKPLPEPVTLAAVKADPRLKDMALTKYARLSVQPVTEAEWKMVCAMGGVNMGGVKE